MFRTFGTALAAPAALSLLIVACSGSGDKTDDTARDIRSEELARMVLDLGQFGPEVAGFVSEDGSGPLSLEQTAEEEDDPESEKADLQQFGWVAAHKGSFEAPQSVEGQAGGVGSTVYLFATADALPGISRIRCPRLKHVHTRRGSKA